MNFNRAILFASFLILVSNFVKAQASRTQINCETELLRYNMRASAITDDETGKWYSRGSLSVDGAKASYYWSVGLGSTENRVKDGLFNIDLDSTKVPQFKITVTATGADIYIECKECITKGGFRLYWEDQPAPKSKLLIWHFSNDRISDALKAREVLNECLLKR